MKNQERRDTRIRPEDIRGCISDVPGVQVGHAQSEPGNTGCTVLMLEDGAIAGIDIGGSAPATRETDLLNPTNMIMKIHAVLLTGGSTIGLGAASGVQKFLREQDIGYHAQHGVVVPIVPTAAIFDLDVGRPHIYPDVSMGYAACLNTSPFQSKQGAVGAGIGGICGKVLGSEHAMRGGLGTASQQFDDNLVIGALAVVNSWGDVVNPTSGEIVAGALAPENPDLFLNTERYLEGERKVETRFFGMNTTLCVVATNAKFTREQTTKLAMMAQDGIARSVRPSHTIFDGDVVFALSTGQHEIDINIAGTIAARMVSLAIVRAVYNANNEEKAEL